MPEGPEIRRAADRLAGVLCGREIESAYVGLPALSNARSLIEATTVESVTCHGKALLTRFSSGYTLYSHNQLYGVWRIVRRDRLPKTNRVLRIGLHTAEHSALLYSATQIELWPTDELNQHPFLRKLGPDVLDPALDDRQIAARLKETSFRGRSLGALYLDQGFIAGIGNYLRSEILHEARLSPDLKAGELTYNQRRRLGRATLRISKRSYETGGITLATSRVRRRKAGEYESSRFAVFGRECSDCDRCGARIRRREVSARRLYWCPACQQI